MDSEKERQGLKRTPGDLQTMRAVKVIFFDAAGTLFHLPRSVGFHYADVASRFGWNADADSVGKAFRALWSEMPPPETTREAKPDDDRGWWRELVDRVLERSEAPDGFDRDGYFGAVYEEFTQPGVWELYPETLEVLDALATSHRLCVLSNFDRRLRTVLAQLGVLARFDEVIISSEVGADKPDPWIFQHAAARAGVEPHEALLVGDDPECDVAGAHRAGWHAFHVERPQTTLRDLLRHFLEPLMDTDKH